MKYVGVSTPSYTIPPRSLKTQMNATLSDNKVPPNRYNPEKYKKYLESRKNGLLRAKEKRPNLILKTEGAPVGSYNIASSPIKKSKGNQSMQEREKNRERKLFQNFTKGYPGPGAYSIRDEVVTNKTHSYMGYKRNTSLEIKTSGLGP